MLDKLKVYEWIYKRPYLKPFAALFNFLVFDTLSIIFLNLEWDKALLGLKNIRFYPIIVILGLYIFTSFIKIPKEKREKPKEVEEKEKKRKKVE